MLFRSNILSTIKFQLLLKSFNQLVKKYNNIKLVYLGSAPPNQENFETELKNQILNNEIKNLKDFYEKQKKLQIENVVPELLNVEENFENDIKVFKKNFNKFNKIINENFDKISKEKKENLTKEIEFMNKKIEKILKEFD